MSEEAAVSGPAQQQGSVAEAVHLLRRGDRHEMLR